MSKDSSFFDGTWLGWKLPSVVFGKIAVILSDRKLIFRLNVSSCSFSDETDRQQLETFSLIIHFWSGRITASLQKTTDGNLQPNRPNENFPSVQLRSVKCIPFRR
uniref:Uncharacterized protein n=1 Tax=Romanomermis culicivorax TaxID=13658 RepID=A0A915J8K1_ROMCU